MRPRPAQKNTALPYFSVAGNRDLTATIKPLVYRPFCRNPDGSFMMMKTLNQLIGFLIQHGIQCLPPLARLPAN